MTPTPETKFAAERAINLTAHEVRLALAGEPFQVRRVVKPQPDVSADGTIRFPWATFFPGGNVHTWGEDRIGGQNWQSLRFPEENKFEQALLRTEYPIKSPFGGPGARLWGREAWAYSTGPTDGSEPNADNSIVIFREREGAELLALGTDLKGCWKTATQMPRWASRLNLTTERVWVEKDNGVWVWVGELKAVKA